MAGVYSPTLSPWLAWTSYSPMEQSLSLHSDRADTRVDTRPRSLLLVGIVYFLLILIWATPINEIPKVMDYDEACFMHLIPGVVHNFPKARVYLISVPYAQKDPRFLIEKRRGQPREFWSLVSTIDGSRLPEVGVEELLCGTPSTW